MSRPRSGVALVEILLGLGLTTLLLQALFPLLATSLLAWNTAVARLTAHQTARMAMESMNDRWLLAKITGPLRGTFSRPEMRGLYSSRAKGVPFLRASIKLVSLLRCSVVR